MTRIFEVGMEHTSYGPNWSRKNIEARTAIEAMRKAKKGEPRSIRPLTVKLLAEADA